MSIAYFAHELADPAVQKRVKMLRAGGRPVTLLGFERARFGGTHMMVPQPHVLGQTKNGKLIERAFTVLSAIPRAYGLRRYWSRADALMARNLEMLFIVRVLALMLRLDTRIIYECLDIHPLMLKPGRAGKAMRWIERWCLERVSLLLTSSPAFVHHYFEGVQDFAGETLIVENKVLAETETETPSEAPAAGPPWRIAWCGVLRCAKSFDILCAAAERHPDLISIELWGAPALDQIPDFQARIAALPNVSFRGRYKPEDLPRIYANAHFVWAVDFYEAGGNSDWLLPNRLYEGLYYGAIPIAVEGVETARWLEERAVGVVLPQPLTESLEAFLRACGEPSYQPLRDAAHKLDRSLVAFTLDNCRALIADLVKQEARL